MIKKASITMLFGFTILAVATLFTTVSVKAATSISDLEAAPSASPVIDYSTPLPTAEATPEALPTAGASSALLITLALVFAVSTGLYFVLPSKQN